MKLDAYEIKSAIMDARWDVVAAALDRHYGLPGLAVALLESNPHFETTPNAKPYCAVGAYIRSPGLSVGSYYYGWHEEYGFEDRESTVSKPKIMFYAPWCVYLDAGMTK